MRALLAGARGEAADPAPVIAAMGATLRVQRARRGVQGRGADHAVRKRDRRPDGAGRSRTRSTPRATRCAGRSARRWPTNWPRRRRRPRRASDLSPDGQGRAAAARRWRWGCSPRPIRRARAALAKAQYDAADNMTDRQARAGRAGQPRRARARGGVRRFLRALCRRRAGDRQMVRAAGRGASAPTRSTWSRRWRGIPTSASRTPTGCARWSAASPPTRWAFHQRVGRGYRLLADMIIEVDAINPQVAARLVPPLGPLAAVRRALWRR